MKVLQRLLALALALVPIDTYANNINFTNLNANFGIYSNAGFGDNMGGQLGGPGAGVSLKGLGGTATGWFDNDDGAGYLPGQSGIGPVSIFFDTGSLTIGSQVYDFSGLETFSTLSTNSFTFPTNGKSFGVTLPATLEVNGVIFGDCPPSNACSTFNLQSKPGKLRLNFGFDAQNGGYYYGTSGYFTTTPEPSTLVLLGTGISAVSWRAYRKKRPTATPSA